MKIPMCVSPEQRENFANLIDSLCESEIARGPVSQSDLQLRICEMLRSAAEDRIANHVIQECDPEAAGKYRLDLKLRLTARSIPQSA